MRNYLWVRSKGEISKLFTFMNKEMREEYKRWNQIDGIYLEMSIAYRIIQENDTVLLSKLNSINKPIILFPPSFYIYQEISDEEIDVDDDLDSEVEDSAKVSKTRYKLEYLNTFYTFIEDEGYYTLEQNNFLKHLDFCKKFMGKIKLLDKKREEFISLTNFIKITDQPALEETSQCYKIAPFQFISERNDRNIITLENVQERKEFYASFDVFVLYTNLEYFSNLNDAFLDFLSSFKEILIWIPDFNEIYATENNLISFQSGLQKLIERDFILGFLNAGMYTHVFLDNLLNFAVHRLDFYPGFNVNPLKSNFGRKTKRIFFPYYGVVTEPERILAPGSIEKFECNCYTCKKVRDKLIVDGNIDDLSKDIITALTESHTMCFYHNLFGFFEFLRENKKIPEEKGIGYKNNMQIWSDIFGDE